MNLLNKLWRTAFTYDLALDVTYLKFCFGKLKHREIPPFLDLLIEIGAWEVLFHCLVVLHESQSYLLHYAYFRASQYLKLRTPFTHLSNIFPLQFNPSLLSCSQSENYAFYDYGGLGDFVDNLTRISSLITNSTHIYNFRLIVPDPIFTLFKGTNLESVLVRSGNSKCNNFRKCHISHLLSYLEHNSVNGILRCSLKSPLVSFADHEYILFNPYSGFKNDSLHNSFSYFKRSPGPNFWSPLTSILSPLNFRPLSPQHQFDTSLLINPVLDDEFLPSSALLYSTISQILSSKIFVTVDTFSAHLSLSLGHPTIVVIPTAYDPRWSYYLDSSRSELDPYSSAVFFTYNPYADQYKQAIKLSHAVHSLLATMC